MVLLVRVGVRVEAGGGVAEARPLTSVDWRAVVVVGPRVAMEAATLLAVAAAILIRIAHGVVVVGGCCCWGGCGLFDCLIDDLLEEFCIVSMTGREKKRGKRLRGRQDIFLAGGHYSKCGKLSEIEGRWVILVFSTNVE